MRHILVCFALLLFGMGLNAQTPALLLPALIHDSLKKDASTVYQLDEMEITVKSIEKMNIRVHSIATIMNEKGMRHSSVYISVDKFQKLEQASVKVFAADGREVLHYKKKDFNLQGAYDGISLATDDKAYSISFPVPGFPCTVETEYELELNGFTDIPRFFFGSSENSYLKSRFILKTSIPVQYKSYNFNLDPGISTEGNFTTYSWERSNIPVITTENKSFGLRAVAPYIDVSPSEFSYDGYKGSLKSWKEFGNWLYPFYEEQGEIPKEKIEFYKNLVSGASTDRERISILYHYLQKETRYVSIQFGIGGFKPFTAAFAEKMKYGDCKGLTHYMKYMLQCIGIKSYAAIINAGKNEFPVDAEFASNIFNHVILCVPNGKDTIWLECTGKQTYPGILGSFTENRNALLVTENGGIIVQTPKSDSKNNVWNAVTHVELDSEGGALARSRIFLSGEFWEELYAYTNSETRNNIKNFLVHQLGFKNPDDFEFKIINDSSTGHNIEINMAYGRLYDFKTGSKYFYPVRHYKLNDETIKENKIRSQDYLFDFPYIKQDSTIYHLPPKTRRENILPNKLITTPYVTYKNEWNSNESGSELYVKTFLSINNYKVSAQQFNNVAAAFEEIKKDENQKLIFKTE